MELALYFDWGGGCITVFAYIKNEHNFFQNVKSKCTKEKQQIISKNIYNKTMTIMKNKVSKSSTIHTEQLTYHP